MEQFYYLSDEFLKAHFNIPELGNYVLVQYRDGDQFFVSLGRKIKALRKQYRLFVDLRRGKICNPYADETHGLSCQILGRAVVKPNKKKREILVFNKNGELCITIAYEHIEKLYKDCWCGQDICSDLSLDDSAYIISRNFVDKCREKGINIIWKSFPNHPHDVPPDSLKLARAFLAYYHQLYQRDLGGSSMRNINRKILFIGDDQEGRFYPVDSPKARNVLREDRVLFSSLEIATAWGKPEK